MKIGIMNTIIKSNIGIQHILKSGWNTRQYKKRSNSVKLRTIVYNNNKIYINKETYMLNINTTFYLLRKDIAIIKNIFLKGGILLYSQPTVNNSVTISETVPGNKYIQSKNYYIVQYNWINGLLSNNKMLFKRAQSIITNAVKEKINIWNRSDKNVNKRKFIEKWISVSKLIYLPQIIMFINNKDTVVYEGIKSNIPCIIVGTDKIENTNRNSMIQNTYYTKNIISDPNLYLNIIVELAKECSLLRYMKIN